MDKTALTRHAHRVLRDAIIPELPSPYFGKVRDNYDLPDGRRIIIASDRISAFDRILAAIPFKAAKRPLVSPPVWSIISRGGT